MPGKEQQFMAFHEPGPRSKNMDKLSNLCLQAVQFHRHAGLKRGTPRITRQCAVCRECI